MKDAEKKSQENSQSLVRVKAACELTGNHTAQFHSAESGQCLFLCKDCPTVITEIEDSQP